MKVNIQCEKMDWRHLFQHVFIMPLAYVCLAALRGFIEQCRGQAVGGLARKNKRSGEMQLREGKDSPVFWQFCVSCRQVMLQLQ